MDKLKFTSEFELKVLSTVEITETGCWEKSGTKKGTYGKVRIAGETIFTHRASYLYHFKSIPSNLFVLHKCDNPSCCNPEHLFLGTQLDNMQDMQKKGRRVSITLKGDLNGNSRLKEAEVINIFLSNVPREWLARNYAVSVNTIDAIKTGRIWKHITEGLGNPTKPTTRIGIKLDENKVRIIYTSKLSSAELATQFKISTNTVSAIRRKVYWKTFTDKLDLETVR